MTPQEKQDVVRTARVIRAGRKLIGKDQRTIANLLQVSQAALSKIEAGILMPSTSQWFRLCQAFGIESEHSYKSGFIDNCSAATSEPTYPESRFKIPQKYLRHQGSKVRAIRPLIRFFADKLGEARLLEYFKHLNIDPDFFVIYDNQLNIRFNLELVTWLIESGNLKRDEIATMTKPLDTAEMHGRLHNEYVHAATKKQLLRSLLGHITKYESNFSYAICDEKADLLTLSVTPSPEMKYFDYKGASLGSFLCDYKKEYVKRFTRYVGGSAAGVREIECHFKGMKRCLYEINLTS
ncbi:helix-turn-helix transcriptional regulator [Bdellovibrionota bacterium FG-1]